MSSHGYDVSVIPVTKEGIIDLEILKKEIDHNTILVSVAKVDSELGTIQPIEKIADLIKDYPNCLFHTDATQAIGKVDINYDNVDFITFAPHKFFGLNGFGVLVNKNNNKLVPLIHGGKSTTIYRSGTPVTANVLALNKAFDLAIKNLKTRYKYIKELNDILRNSFSNNKYIHINSTKNTIPNTLNISLINKDTKAILKQLEKKEIYLSTTTACSLGSAPSKTVFAMTNSKSLAENTVRISISHLTTKEDIELFINSFLELLED